MKTCFKCAIEKPLSEFYRHSAMAGGRLNKCKECTKKDTRDNRNLRLEYYKMYDRARGSLPHRVKARKLYQMTEAGKQKMIASKKKWIKENPQKRTAQNKVNSALKRGTLKKMNCEICGSEKSHAHHDDYSKPLDVRWLCPLHHSLEHKMKRAM